MKPLLLIVLFVYCTQALLFFDDKDEILELHNRYRKEHKLKWSSKLAIEAQLFVTSCDFHKTISYKNTTDNIALGYKSWSDTINGWYNSGKYYDSGHPGYVKKAGPFIAMTWKSSTFIGCASLNCGKSGRIYQCEYYPSIPADSIFESKEYKKNIDKYTSTK